MRAAAFILLLSLLPVLASEAGAALPRAATEDRWVEVRSRHFRVFSNADEAVPVRVARYLDRLAQALELTTVNLKAEDAPQVRVYVFRDMPSFEPYCPFARDEGSVTAGFHISGADADLIACVVVPGSSVLGFAAHEYLHAVVSSGVGTLPLWADEGLAEFFSTFNPRRRGADIGALIPEHMVWLRQHIMPLRDLVLMPGYSSDYAGGARRGTFYAESWGLVHMLVKDRAGGDERLGHLLAELARGTVSTAAFEEIYGPAALDSLERELRKRVTLGALPYLQWSFAEEFDQLPVVRRVLDPIEVRLVLGELLAGAPAKLGGPAREHLESVWREDSTRVLAAALLGSVAEGTNDRAGAERWFARVARSDTRDVRALGIAGAALAMRLAGTDEAPRWPARGPSAATLLGRGLLTRALREQPEATEWLVPFGMSFLDDTEGVFEGIDALMRAEASGPSSSRVTGAMAVLSARGGNRGAALAAYRRIPAGPERVGWRFKAGWAVARATVVDIQELVRQGRFQAADSLAAGLAAAVPEPGVSSLAQGWRDWLAQNARPPASQATAPSEEASPGLSDEAADSVAAASRDRVVARVRGAISSGEYIEAETLAEAARDSAKDPSLRAQLNALMREARNRRRLDAADCLRRAGLVSEGCRLLDVILADRPSSRLRREIEERHKRWCVR